MKSTLIRNRLLLTLGATLVLAAGCSKQERETAAAKVENAYQTSTAAVGDGGAVPVAAELDRVVRRLVAPGVAGGDHGEHGKRRGKGPRPEAEGASEPA